METEDRNNSSEALLNNEIIFSILTDDKPPDEKLNRIIKCLNKGADVNAVEATNGNTLLHVAAIKGELDVVKTLVQRGADVTIKNRDNKTVSDIISQLSRTPKNTELSNILTTTISNKNISINSIAQPLCCITDEKNMTYYYQKRSGTAGISGQLYETKLLTLVLLRTLFNDNIKEFVMGTNIEGIGALDDIVLRYKIHDTQTSKMLFLQAKHKDNPTRDKLTVEELLKSNGDFSLHKYMESYIKIKQKFATDNNDPMFQGSMKDIEFVFVIYTPAKEHIAKKEILHYSDEEKIISTGEESKTFRFKYDDNDVDCLVSKVVKSRVKQLAKNLTKCIFADNFNSIMAQDLIKTYHVYLAQHVIKIDNTSKEITELSASNANNKSNHNYNRGTFRQSFLNSNDHILSFLRQTICKEITETKCCQQDEAKTMMKSLSFKLPLAFGNQHFCFNGSPKKQERRLVYLCSLFEKLFEKFFNDEGNYIFIKLDEDSVGPDGIVQSADVQIRLANLVGNLLVQDNETEMLKFNLNEDSLSNDNILILHRLKSNKKYDLSKYRFDIYVNKFPELTLNRKDYDHKLVIDFLTNLKLYTNQAKEDEVENIVKKEIYDIYSVQQHQDLLFHFKCDSIYLKIHDEIQKWWKTSNSAPYLNKASKLFQQAEQAISDIPLLNKIHFICSQKMTNNSIEFEVEAINALRLDWFLSVDEKIVIIVSNEVDFTCKKIMQYFNNIKKSNQYIVIDLEVITIENCLEIRRAKNNTTIPVLVVITRVGKDAQKLNIITKSYKGKIIIITNYDNGNKAQIMHVNYVVHIDNMNSFRNLSSDVRKLILEERKLIFLGLEVNVNTVLDDISLNLLSPNLLYQLIDNRPVMIGKSLLNHSYEETIGYYLTQSVCRYITLDLNNYVNYYQSENKQLFFANGLNTVWTPPEDSDLILLTSSAKVIEETCKRHSKCNIHWFQNNDKDNLIWNKSYGSISTLFKHIERGANDNYTLKINTLKDIDQRVVIISAEPGMGKSTLLTHVAINTIRMQSLHRTLWLLKINFLDYTYQFNKWKEEKTDISLITVITLLYNAFKNKDLQNSECDFKEISKYMFVDENNEICLNEKSVSEIDLHHFDLSELKLFNHFYNNDRIAIFCDGFDEICPDYTDEVIQLLNTLKTSKVARLWVTSRPYSVLNQLEISLGTFAFHLKPFSIEEQKTYLLNVWSQRLDFDKKFGLYQANLDNFYAVIKNILNDTDGKFLGLPLHLYMIAEIYELFFKDQVNFEIHRLPDKFFEDIKDISNLITLYRKFTNMKFVKIRFGEKKHTMNLNDPDIRKMIELEQKMFEETHKKLAAYSLLDRNIVLAENEIKDVYDFIESVKAGVEKTGIVLNVVCDEPKFVHKTFAEYFAVEFLFEKLLRSTDSSSSMWRYIIDNILTGDNYGIRRFINDKLQRDQVFTYLMSYLSHLTFHLMLAQSSLPTNALFVAIAEGLEDNRIAKFLLQSIKTSINKNNLSVFLKLIHVKCIKNCVLCTAIQKRNHFFVKYVINLVMDIEQTKMRDLFCCAGSPFLLILYTYDREIYKVIFDALQHDKDLFVDLFTWKPKHGIQLTAARCLAESSIPILYIKDYLKRLSKKNRVKIFSVRDNSGQLPLHYAARLHNYDFFNRMDEMLGRRVFRRMCLKRDNEGFTPICRLPYNEMFFKNLESVLQRVYKDVYVDVEDFVFYKLPKLHPKKVNSWSNPRNYMTSSSTEITVGNANFYIKCSGFNDALQPNKTISQNYRM